MRSESLSKFFFSVCLLASSSSVCAESAVAAPAKSSQLGHITGQSVPLLPPSELKALADLEMSCFQRTFDDDLPEKRVKRLELFTRGMGQSGTFQERIAGLKEFIGRQQQHVAKDQLAPTKRNLGQSVSNLEKSILKKTNPNLDLNTRLAALEKKVFGTTFINIPMGQRIARLQKTIGVGDEDLAEIPRSLRHFPTGPQMMQPNSMFNSPFMSPYGSPNDMTVDPDINQHMSEMFDTLNQQLRQLQRVPPNSYLYSPYAPHESLKQSPTAPGYSDGLPQMPRGSLQSKPSLPPYMDPNSI